MAKLKDRHIMNINKLFEDALSRLSKIDRQKKMRMRRKVQRCVQSHAIGAKRRSSPTAGKEDGNALVS